MTLLSPKYKFLKIIVIEAVFWLTIGSLLCHWVGWAVVPYLWITGATVLGLIILMILVHLLVKSELPVGMRVAQFIFFSFFKLVCLAFLAITLKRFQELSSIPTLIGVSFYWVAPVIAGLFCSKDE